MSSEPNHNRQKNHKALTKKQKEAIRRKKRQRKIILLVVEILVVLILAIAILIVRYASWTYPSVIRDKHTEKSLPHGKTPRPEDDELA